MNLDPFTEVNNLLIPGSNEYTTVSTANIKYRAGNDPDRNTLLELSKITELYLFDMLGAAEWPFSQSGSLVSTGKMAASSGKSVVNKASSIFDN